MPSESRFPEHDKLAEIRDKSQMIGEFMDWLRADKKMHFCEEVQMKMLVEEQVVVDDGKRTYEWVEVLKPVEVFRPLRIQELLAEFFGIDQEKLDQEKQQMIDEIRAANDRRQHEHSE